MKTINDLLPLLRERFQKPDLINGKKGGTWKSYSTNEFLDIVDQVSAGLLRLGCKKGTCVANMSTNRPEWNLVDFGMLQIGVWHVPIYPTLAEKDLAFILNDAQVEVMFVEDQELYNKVQSVQSQVPSLRNIYSFDPVNGIPHWQELLQKPDQAEIKSIAEARDQVGSEDLATLIYTSGTTGNPKGVMLTHGNIVSNFVNSEDILPFLGPQHKALSFLPLCHIFERMVGYMYLAHGISIWYAESLETIGDNLKEVRPHYFTTVPRLLEKVYDKIVNKGKELSGIKKGLFFWALNLGLRYELHGVNGWWYEFQLSLAKKIIFKKWKEALGGNIIAVISGGAALQPRLARVFTAGGIDVLEGYGLTETSPVIACNRYERKDRKFGTVGVTIPGVRVKIAQDGEILCKGPNVMKGYYKQPKLTDEVIDKDGWFHTGDIGELQDGKFLRITDRKKEMFKTAGGKYVTPQLLENKFKESVFIEQVMVVGENQKFPGALIVPAFTVLEEWCKRKNVSYDGPAQIIENEQVKARIQEEIEKYNKDFGHWEQVKKFCLLPREFTIDNGELTPKLSLKRKNIAQHFQKEIESLYS